MKVMIVDDDRIFAEELAVMLRHAGYEVVCYHDSVSAVNRAEGEKPDAILLDIRMDHLNGFQAAFHLRKFQATAAVPIIGISGHCAGDESGLAVTRYGMNAFLQKPFYPWEVITLLEQLTGGVVSDMPQRAAGRS